MSSTHRPFFRSELSVLRKDLGGLQFGTFLSPFPGFSMVFDLNSFLNLTSKAVVLEKWADEVIKLLLTEGGSQSVAVRNVLIVRSVEHDVIACIQQVQDEVTCGTFASIRQCGIVIRSGQPLVASVAG